MDNTQLIKELTSLLRTDYDAVRAYEQAMKNIHEEDIRHRLQSFKNDHERHVSEITEAITRLGGEAPAQAMDFRGFLMEGFTEGRSSSGTKGALKAMHLNEKIINRKYAELKTLDLPGEIMELVSRNIGDEQRHLAYIESALELAPVAR